MNMQHVLLTIILCYSSLSHAMDADKARELQPSSSHTSDNLSTPEHDLRTFSFGTLSSTPQSLSAIDSNANYHGLGIDNITAADLHSPEFERKKSNIIRHSSTGIDPEEQRNEVIRKIRLGILPPERDLIVKLWNEKNALVAQKDELVNEKNELEKRLVAVEQKLQQLTHKRRFCACLGSNQ